MKFTELLVTFKNVVSNYWPYNFLLTRFFSTFCLNSIIPKIYMSAQFSSVTQSCPIHCDTMDYRTPGLPVPHQLPELVEAHIHQVSDVIQPSHPVVPFSSFLQLFPAAGSFPVSQFFTSGGKSIGISVSASVIPKNIHDWFPLGLPFWFPCSPRDSLESSLTLQFKSISSFLTFLPSTAFWTLLLTMRAI